MNCSQAHDHLPSLLYGELRTEQSAEVAQHLRSCAACQERYAALQQVSGLLDALPVSEVGVDLPRLYRAAADRQVRRLRRWRRLAIGLCGAAAALLLLSVGLNLEMRVQPHQVTLRWGAAPPATQEQPLRSEEQTSVRDGTTPSAPSLAASADGEARIRILSELMQLLATDVDTRDRRQQQELVRLQAQMQSLRQQSAQWHHATERDVTALYAAQFVSRKGTTP